MSTNARTRRRLRGLAIGAGVVFLLAGCRPASFDHNRTVRIIVGMAPGGGQDLYARVIAAHLGRYLPGQPAVVVENMPGAAGLIAVNHLVRATPDGLTLGLIDGRPAVETLIAEAPSVDVRNLPIVGSPGGDGVVCAFSRASGFTLDVWRSGRVPRIGLTGRGSSGAAYSLLVSEALSLPIRPVFGYSGTSDIRAAIASGEVDGLCMNRASLVASFQPLDAYVVAIQLGVGGDASLAGVPAADSMVASARGASLLSVAAAIGRLARCLVLPPNTPDERVRALRNAFERTVRDPAFLEAARKSRLDVQPESADDLNKAIADLLSLPPGLRREIGRLLSGAGTS